MIFQGSETEAANQVDDGGKKKTKFVALYSNEGKAKDVVLLKGRHVCECMATKHDLVNNCLQCGKIVCSQEGDFSDIPLLGEGSWSS